MFIMTTIDVKIKILIENDVEFPVPFTASVVLLFLKNIIHRQELKKVFSATSSTAFATNLRSAGD